MIKIQNPSKLSNTLQLVCFQLRNNSITPAVFLFVYMSVCLYVCLSLVLFEGNNKDNPQNKDDLRNQREPEKQRQVYRQCHQSASLSRCMDTLWVKARLSINLLIFHRQWQRHANSASHVFYSLIIYCIEMFLSE